MTEIVSIDIENEMDLILCHKRSMKLAELCGLSVIVQTSFATAVSEISRCVITREKNKSVLSLGLNDIRNNRKELIAVLETTVLFGREHHDSIKYATRLADSLKINELKSKTQIIVTEKVNYSGLLNDSRINAFINYFKKELPLSPYDELRKKNIQLLELSEKLKESEDQYKSLSETLPLMVLSVSATGHLIYGNQWLKDHFNLSEIQPGKIHWTALIDPKDHRNFLGLWEKAQNTGMAFKTEAKLKTKNFGDSLWHLISLIPSLNDDGNLVGWTGFFVDIHAQKLVEETLKNNVELKNAQKQLLSYQARLENNLKELNKSNHDLEQFAYIASHDLQEPLRKIQNFSELLERNFNDSEKAKKFLDKINNSSERMSALIKAVLNYSRLSKAEAKFEQTDLQQIFENVKSDVELVIEEKNASVISDALPVIIGIQQQLHQLFYNLINNALKFSNEKPVIRVLCRELEYDEVQNYPDLHVSVKYIELIFKDNGIGFEQEYAEQIFTIFKRLNPATQFEGTGIGLALCKKIADNHHGIISAQSQPGIGTEFKVILPVA